MPRQQEGYIWRKGHSWHGRWRDDVYEDGRVVRKQRSEKLAEYCDQYRTESDVRPLLEAKLRPINEGRVRPESTQSVEKYVDDFYLPYAEENLKPSTYAGYKTLWEIYLRKRLTKIALRDFRTVDAANLISAIHREHGVGRTMLKHIKSLLSGVFTYAKNQGVLDGVNPIRDAMISKKAASPEEMHAASPDEVLAIMSALEKAGEYKARAAVALMFFAGLRPGEARGLCWEDFDGKRLMIRQSVWHTYTTSPKTQSSVKRACNRAARHNPSRIAGGGQKPNFRADSARAVWKAARSPHLANRVVIPILKKAGVPWHGFYSLRRGVGTAVTALSKRAVKAVRGEELQRRNYSQATTRGYILAVKQFAEYFGKSPEKLGAEEIRRYQLYLLNEKKFAPGTVEIRMSALRFAGRRP